MLTYHHRKDEIFYVLEAELSFRSAIAQSSEQPEQWSSYRAMCATLSQSNRSRGGCSFWSLPLVLEGWFKEFGVPAPGMILMPSQSMMEFPSFSRINTWEVSHAIQE